MADAVLRDRAQELVARAARAPAPDDHHGRMLGPRHEDATGVVVDDHAHQVRHLFPLLQAAGDHISLHVVHPRPSLGEVVGVRRALEVATAQPGGDDLHRAAAFPALGQREGKGSRGAGAAVHADDDGALLVSHAARVAAACSRRIRPWARMPGTFVPTVADRCPCRTGAVRRTLGRVTPTRSHLWYDVAWPTAAGLVTGLGLVAAYRWTGPLMFVVAFGVLELTVAPVAWSLLTEMGLDVRRVALRVAPAAAVVTLAVIGLADLIGAWSFLVVVVALATSPLLQGWSRDGIRAVLAERVSPRTETRRRFDDIVAHGFGTSDEDLPPL